MMGFSDSFFGVSGGKKTIRKTGEVVDVIAFHNPENGARSDEDWVSYIDSNGVEHIKEHLNIQFDFKTEDPFAKNMETLLKTADKLDPWEVRRYELVKEMFSSGRFTGTARDFVKTADDIIAALKKSHEATEFIEGVQMDDGYDNIGIGEIVEAFDGPERVKKFVFTDKKDIVGFKGDNGRWAVGDRVKVYIKHRDPAEEERPVQ